MNKNVYLSLCEVPGYSYHLLMEIEFSQQSFENNLTSNFTKIHPVGAEFFRADRRTDMTKLIVAVAILRMPLKTGKVYFLLAKRKPAYQYEQHYQLYGI
jgi:hypothetical protein